MASFPGADVNPPTITTGPAATVLLPVLPGAAVVATAGIQTAQQVAVTLSHTSGTLTRRTTTNT